MGSSIQVRDEQSQTLSSFVAGYVCRITCDEQLQTSIRVAGAILGEGGSYDSFGAPTYLQ